MADTNLKVTISAVDKASRTLGTTGKSFEKFGGVVRGVAGVALGAFALGAASAAEEAEQANARLEQVFRSMGDESGKAAKAAIDYADNLSKKIGVEDEAIKQSQALLATFASVSDETARSTGLFDRATAAAADLAAAGFGDMNSQAKALGKALEDPTAGINALRKSGVTFTEAEKEKIRVLTESGEKLEAQNIIMAAVEKQVGGVAEATATDSQKMKVAFGELQESIGAALLPAVGLLSEGMVKVADAFGAMPEGAQAVITAVGLVGAAAAIAVPKLIDFVGGVKDTISWMKQVKPSSAVAAGGLGVVAAAAGLVVAGVIDGKAALKEMESFDPSATRDGLNEIREKAESVEDGINSWGEALSWFKNAAAWGDLDEAWRNGAQQVQGYESALLDVQYAEGATAELVRKAAEGVWDQNKAYLENKQALREAVAAKSSATSGAQKLAEAESAAGDAAADAAEKTKAYKDQLDALNAPALDVRSSMRGLEAAYDDATEALKENGRTLDITTPKGRANADALDTIAQKAIQAAEAQRVKDGDDKRANETLDIARQRLQKQAEGFGLTKAEAKKYVDQVLKIPKKAETKVVADVKKATTDLKSFVKEFNGKKITFYVTAEGNALPSTIINPKYLPGRASGGPVRAGRPYIVGEKRPELFVPETNGQILPRVPAASGGGAVGGQAPIVINMSGVVGDKDAVARVVEDAVGRALRRGSVRVA